MIDTFYKTFTTCAPGEPLLALMTRTIGEKKHIAEHDRY